MPPYPTQQEMKLIDPENLRTSDASAQRFLTAHVERLRGKTNYTQLLGGEKKTEALKTEGYISRAREWVEGTEEKPGIAARLTAETNPIELALLIKKEKVLPKSLPHTTKELVLTYINSFTNAMRAHDMNFRSITTSALSQ